MHFGPDTFAVRVIGDAMFPAFRDGEFAYIDPDIPMESGLFVGVQWEGTNTAVRLYKVEGDRRFLRTLNPDEVDCIVDFGNETMICGVVVFWGRRV